MALPSTAEPSDAREEHRTLGASTYVQLPWPEEVLDLVEKKYGRAGRERFERFEEMALEHHDSSDRVKLEEVNRFFNKIHYRSDYKGWGSKEYWALPTQTLGRNSGDCEDMAIAKYVALTTMGVDPARLYLVFGLWKKKQGHAVLAYAEPGDGWDEALILDNIKKRIVPAAQRKDITPNIAINDREMLYRPDPGSRVEHRRPEDLIGWDDLIARREELDPDFYTILAGSNGPDE
jgi:predicted transglutaminase-like cysteine proteinase